jgi:probable F420-dependent oxidoreductase
VDEQRTALRAALGPVGVWSFALQGRRAPEAQAAVRAYEDLGYPATWYPESIGSREAFTHAGLLLAGTDRMIVGTGIASIHARDPMATANGARTLSEQYPGRFVLGLGVSHAPAVAARGGSYGRPVEQMAAYLDAIAAAAWTGPAEAVLPPIVLAALGPRMLELAAARTAGAHPYFVPVEHTALARERLGRGPLLVVEQTAVLDTDRDRALETARAFAARYLAAVNYANNLRRLGWSEDDLADGGSERLLAALVVQGDAATIAARVREHLDAGADHVCVQVRATDAVDPAVDAYGELRAALGGILHGGAA